MAAALWMAMCRTADVVAVTTVQTRAREKETPGSSGVGGFLPVAVSYATVSSRSEAHIAAMATNGAAMRSAG